MIIQGRKFLTLTKSFSQCLYNQVRTKKLTHWKQLEKQDKPIIKAIENFDDFYKNVFGNKWHSIRLALLSPQKYCALVNNYSDTDRIISDLENEGAMNLRNLFDLQRKRLMEKSKYNSKKRQKQNIYKLDKKLEGLAKKKLEEEIDSLYPESSTYGNKNLPAEENTKEVLEKGKKEHSLEASMSSADIDWSRQINPELGVGAGALYEFIPATKLKGKEDWVPEAQHYTYYNESSDFPVEIEKERELNFPKHLNAYIFESGNISRFNPARNGTTGVTDYYLMDGSSLFPVLALDLSVGDTVLDMCAAPGGKSLVCLQTLYPDLVVCNDSSLSRMKRIQSVMEEFLFDWEKRVKITQMDATGIEDTDTYNKILVDVPCTTDRHSVTENDNNIFKPTRVKERIQLPELQANLLFSALKLVKVGGTVVYSTCTLSPIQNDGVVHMALKKIWEETSIKLVVKDLSEALLPAKEFFSFGDNFGFRYGHIVLPYLPANFGPLYFCKIVRTS